MQCRVCGKDADHDACATVTCRGDSDICCECCLRGLGTTDPLGDHEEVQVPPPEVCVINCTKVSIPPYLNDFLVKELKDRNGNFYFDDIGVRENPKLCYEIHGQVEDFLITVNKLGLRPRQHVDVVAQKPDYRYSPHNTSIFCSCSNEFVLRKGRFGLFYGCSGFRLENCRNTLPVPVVEALFKKINQNAGLQTYDIISVFANDEMQVKRWRFEFTDAALYTDDAIPLKSVGLIAITYETPPNIADLVSDVEIDVAEPHIKGRRSSFSREEKSGNTPHSTPPPKHYSPPSPSPSPLQHNTSLTRWIGKEKEKDKEPEKN